MAEIKIDNWKTGVAQNPLEGFADMRNIILDGESGFVEIGWKTVRVASTAITDEIIWFDKGDEFSVGSSGTAVGFFAINRDGQVLHSSNGDTWANIFNMQGLTDAAAVKYWKRHLLVTNNATLQGYGPLTTGSAVLTQIGTFQTNTDGVAETRFHPIIVGQDDIVYVGDGRYVASLQEVTGSAFTAGTAGTYTYNANALDLPENYRIKSLGEQGISLMLGTWKGNNSDDISIGDIFPWDRVSDSFELPIQLQKHGIHAIEGINNLLYFISGIEGEAFVTNGLSVQKVSQIPKHITQLSGARWIDAYPQNIMSHKGKLYFAGKSPDTGGTGEEVPGGIGVWSIDLETGALVMENQIDTGKTGATSGTDEVHITALFPVDRNSYLIAFQDEATPDINGIDKVSNTERYTNYAARIDTQYFNVGTKNKPDSFSTIEFELSEPLATGEGVRISYRTNLNDSFTTVRTWDFATDGAITVGNNDFLVTTEGGIQLRVEMTTGAASSTTPKLKSVTIN